MLTACKESCASLKCTQIKLECWLLLQSDSDSPLASRAVGRAACSPEFYPTASAAAPRTKNAWNVRKAWKTSSHAFLLPPNLIWHVSLQQCRIKAAQSGCRNVGSYLEFGTFSKQLKEYFPFTDLTMLKLNPGFFCRLSMTAQLSEKSDSKLQERHILFTFCEV